MRNSFSIYSSRPLNRTRLNRIYDYPVKGPTGWMLWSSGPCPDYRSGHPVNNDMFNKSNGFLNPEKLSLVFNITVKSSISKPILNIKAFKYIFNI